MYSRRTSRQVVAGVFLTVAVVAGCSSNSAVASPTLAVTVPSSASTRSIVVATPSLWPSPSPSPTPRPTGLEQTASGIVWHGEGGDLAPQSFQGIDPELSNGKVVYKDASGSIEAEWKPNLTIGGAATGVFVVRADVVTTLTRAAHDAGHFDLALPLDPRGVPDAQQIPVNLDTTQDGGSTVQRAVIELPEGSQVPLVQFNFKGDGVILQAGPHGPDDWFMCQLGGKDSEIPRGQELDAVCVFGRNGGKAISIIGRDPHGYGEPNTQVGEEFATVSGEVSIDCVSGDLTVSVPVTEDNILTVGGVPVAIMAGAAAN
jgi:hypothetical protein